MGDISICKEKEIDAEPHNIPPGEQKEEAFNGDQVVGRQRSACHQEVGNCVALRPLGGAGHKTASFPDPCRY